MEIAFQVLDRLETPASLLPAQLGRAPLESGEIRLLQTILMSAIGDILAAPPADDVSKAAGLRRRYAEDARRWVGGADATVNFETACAAFEVDVDVARRRISALKPAARRRCKQILSERNIRSALA